MNPNPSTVDRPKRRRGNDPDDRCRAPAARRRFSGNNPIFRRGKVPREGPYERYIGTLRRVRRRDVTHCRDTGNENRRWVEAWSSPTPGLNVRFLREPDVRTMCRYLSSARSPESAVFRTLCPSVPRGHGHAHRDIGIKRREYRTESVVGHRFLGGTDSVTPIRRKGVFTPATPTPDVRQTMLRDVQFSILQAVYERMPRSDGVTDRTAVSPEGLK